MLIFEQEKQDGLSELIVKSSSIAFELVPTTITPQISAAFANLPDFDSIVKKVDLFYFESVLASVGWNKNDDVFDYLELWAAKDSPVNKKINYMHNEADIIGHMTLSRVLDHEGNLINSDTPNDKVPNTFDVCVGGFLYKHWEDDSLRERMSVLIDSISKKNIAVSMECIFPHFDYAIVTPNGEHKIVARAEETSFLTKHLRRYGGTGSYEGHKVGRLLRNMIFTGNALVDRPANPRSLIIKSEASSFTGTNAKIHFSNQSEKNIMDITKEAYDALLKKVEAAEAAAKEVAQKELNEVKAAHAALKEVHEKVVAELNTIKDSFKKTSDELTAAKEISKAHEDKTLALAEQIKTLETQLNEAKAEMDKHTKEMKSSKRKAAMAEIDVDEAKANELLVKFAEVSDELFDEVVKAFPRKKAAEATTLTEKLENAEVTTATVTVPTETQKALAAKASEWFSETLKPNKTK